MCVSVSIKSAQAAEVGHYKTGSDPDSGGGGGVYPGYLFLLFSALCCGPSRRSHAPGVGLRPPYPGGLAVIISSDAPDGRQEIISACCGIVFALMGRCGMPRWQPGRKCFRTGERLEVAEEVVWCARCSQSPPQPEPSMSGCLHRSCIYRL